MFIHRLVLPLFVLSLWCIVPGPARSELAPEEVAVVVNTESPESVRLGTVYAQLRDVPPSHMIRVTVNVKETIVRNDYDELIAKPVRRALNDLYSKGEKIRCLVTTYGIPLRVRAVKPLIMPVTEIEKYSSVLKGKQARMDELQEQRIKNKSIGLEAEKSIRQLKKEIGNLKLMLGNLKGGDTASAVDSELALVLVGDYAIKGMLSNPQMLANSRQTFHIMGRILMVSRLDAPTPELAEGLIHTAIEVEETGLKGRVYLDARGKRGNDAYGRFDEDIRRTAVILKKSLMPVILDDRPGLFGPGEAPDAALYCGWYSHMKYIDAFTWARGAVGYHIASSEAVSLHNPKATYWVKSMIQRGVIASIGPVAEPYLYAFPAPSLFFPLLMSGKYTLVEVFAMTNPFLSWRIILVGDPLYNPFEKNPAYYADNLPDPPY